MRGMFMLLGGAVVVPTYEPPPPTGACDPFARITPTGTTLRLVTEVVPINPTGETLHICQEVT